MTSYGDNLFSKTHIGVTKLEANEITSTLVTAAEVDCGNIDATGDVTARDVDCRNVTSSGTIFWQDFDPPLEVGGAATLATVLQAGNDANEELIDNVGKINMTPNLAGNPPTDGTINNVHEVFRWHTDE
jgi:hypothetical protein